MFMYISFSAPRVALSSKDFAEAFVGGLSSGNGVDNVCELLKLAFAPETFRVKKIGGVSEYNRRYTFNFFSYDHSTDEETGFPKDAYVALKESKFFTVDGVVVKIRGSDLTLPFREVLALEVKSTKLNNYARVQLFLNMLPVLAREGSAVGLLINAVEAKIFKMKVVKGCKSNVDISSKSHSLHPDLNGGLVAVLQDLVNLVH